MSTTLPPKEPTLSCNGCCRIQQSFGEAPGRSGANFLDLGCAVLLTGISHQEAFLP